MSVLELVFAELHREAVSRERALKWHPPGKRDLRFLVKDSHLVFNSAWVFLKTNKQTNGKLLFASNEAAYAME